MSRLTTLKPRIPVLDRAGPAVIERQTASKRGYDYRWQRYRAAWLRDHPLCGDRQEGPSTEHSQCARAGRVVAATDVDHIKRVNGQGDPLFWEPTNHQSLCHACHSVKTQGEGRVESSGGSTR